MCAWRHVDGVALAGGVCILPDVCKCKQWYSTSRDGRGFPMHRKPNGDPQDTGYTGYDCNTPICTQAQRFVLNTAAGETVLVNSSNAGTTFQSGCVAAGPYISLNRTRTSAAYLCGILKWYQGEYLATHANALGVSVNSSGRVVRSNHANYIQLSTEKWVLGPRVAGEGMYACFNNGSCVQPDVCSCPDGWTSDDCSSPLCRHVNAASKVVGCLNRGVCGFRDKCVCNKRPSLLHEVHPDEPKTLTGFNGTDCAMAMCVQGTYDFRCRNVPGGAKSVSSGGEGCYRCPNGGNCTAPDFCTCPPEWTGYDCKTPVCTKHADPVLIDELNTVDALRVADFELDPCGSDKVEKWKGILIGRGNCTAPDTCTCFCRDRSWRNAKGALVRKPWKDPLGLALPKTYIFGTRECLDGWEGHAHPTKGSYFDTCHLQIFVPTWLQRNALMVMGIAAGSIVLILLCYIIIRRRMRQKYLLAKAERRRSRRSSEEERAKSNA